MRVKKLWDGKDARNGAWNELQINIEVPSHVANDNAVEVLKKALAHYWVDKATSQDERERIFSGVAEAMLDKLVFGEADARLQRDLSR